VKARRPALNRPAPNRLALGRLALNRMALNGAGLAVFVVAVFPVFWMIGTAFKPNREIFSTTPRPVPAAPTFEHFEEVLTGDLVPGTSFWQFLTNSAIVAVFTVVISSLLALLAATAVARYQFRFRTTVLIMLLVVQMVPLEALVIPLFVMMRQLNLLDSLAGLVVTYVGFSLPFAVWMLRTFVAAVPIDLEEAAAIDGAGPWQTFWRILFPLVAPGLVATSIFSFITAWNEFVFALTFMSNQDGYTLPIALSFFFGRDTTDWGAVMAASTLLTLPVVAFFLAVQRRMVSGLVSGAVKG
jgi:N,N'-diacetylchitobiose transport system permease protein